MHTVAFNTSANIWSCARVSGFAVMKKLNEKFHTSYVKRYLQSLKVYTGIKWYSMQFKTTNAKNSTFKYTFSMS